MASLIKRERQYQVVIHNERRRYKLPGFGVDSIGKELSEELGRNAAKLLQSRGDGVLSPALRAYVDGLPENIRASMARQGIINGAMEGKPLAVHVDDYRAALVGKGNAADYISDTVAMLRDVFASCGAALGKVTPAKLRAYLAERRRDKPVMGADGKPVKDADGAAEIKRGMSARRHNAHIVAVRGFFNWCIRERRAHENPAAHLAKLNEKTDRRHERRALEPGEVRALLAAAENGAEFAGLTGKERALVYRVAVETGLRLNELATLTRSCVDLDGAAVTVRAAYSKHRREDVLPIREELVTALRPHLERKTPAALAFSLPERWHVRRAFIADLAAAGIASRDDSGRVCDFHALRHTFISSLAAGGVHPKTAQSMARHSSITLTMDRYTHTLRGAETAALAQLPDYTPTEAAGAKRTGTDDIPVDAAGAAAATGRKKGGGGKVDMEQNAYRGAIRARRVKNSASMRQQ